MADKTTQAFPVLNWENNGNGDVAHYQQEGMTLRDYFAAKAMQALLSGAPDGIRFGVEYRNTNAHYAVASYAMADAMLEARNA